MNQLLNDKLNGMLEKFQKMEMFHSINDDDSALEVLKTIDDEEIKVLKSIGEQLVTMAETIKEYKEEVKE
jgi:K+/H+ antiporter YhaU regulatory subunit KhtT